MTRDFFCDEGEYNDMATLAFNSQEVAIKELFHNAGKFTLRNLGIFFVVYFLIACWTYGVSIPSGLFVPCLTIGAAYGVRSSRKNNNNNKKKKKRKKQKRRRRRRERERKSRRGK